MKLFRKLLIGTLAAMGGVACLAATMLAVKVYRHLSLYDAHERHSADWENLGTAFDFGIPGNSDETPGIARVAGFADDDGDAGDLQAKAVIDEELCDAGPEERKIWQTELKGQSPAAIREILSLRRKMSAAEPDSIAGSVELTAADASPPEPQPLPGAGLAPARRGSADALGPIASAIEATSALEQAVLNNITSELAELRRLQEQLKTLRQLHAELSGTARTP
ncbi:MAG: hypothetical protein ACM3U2_00460 [Deltaproteobacteria bacterium]